MVKGGSRVILPPCLTRGGVGPRVTHRTAVFEDIEVWYYRKRRH